MIQTYDSILTRIGPVPFPTFTGERVYMRAFTQRGGLPPDLARWSPTVAAMLDGVDADGPIYLMVDQSEVAAGSAHRRPGLHVDGYWHAPTGTHRGGHGSIASGSWTPPSPWKTTPLADPEAIILAADVEGARAFTGRWAGPIGDGGACDHVDRMALREVPMRAGVAYAGNVAMLHESLPLPVAARRTVVRLSVPGWSP